MSKTFQFIVPGPPHGKERPRKGKYGNMYNPPANKAYEDQIGYFAKDAGIKPCLTICELDVVWQKNSDGEQELLVTLTQTDKPVPEGKKGPDGDNVLKSVGDGLNKIGYKDDSQIRKWSIERL